MLVSWKCTILSTLLLTALISRHFTYNNILDAWVWDARLEIHLVVCIVFIITELVQRPLSLVVKLSVCVSVPSGIIIDHAQMF